MPKSRAVAVRTRHTERIALLILWENPTARCLFASHRKGVDMAAGSGLATRANWGSRETTIVTLAEVNQTVKDIVHANQAGVRLVWPHLRARGFQITDASQGTPS